MEINKELYDKMPIELKKLFKKDEVLELFPESNGAGNSLPNVKITGYGDKNTGTGKSEYFGGERIPFDSGTGSAARFFYCAKASKKDRNDGLESEPDKILARSCQAVADAKRGVVIKEGDGAFNKARITKNNHPTVKPLELGKYLCRLITPPNGTVLDPFMGSGSTGKAAMLENFNFIGIELDPDYYKIAEARIKHAKENPDYYSEKESKKKKEKSETKKQDSAIDSLFEDSE